MLFYLSKLSETFSPLNVFGYITFRTGGAIFTAFILSLIIGPYLVNKLRRYKIGQYQRIEGPQSHLSKQGTPTMGGLLIIITMGLAVLLWARLDDRFIWLLVFTSAALSAVGIWDDYSKLIKKHPRGAPSSLKLGIQLITAFAVTAYLALYPPSPEFATSIIVPYTKGLVINMGVVYFAFSMLVIIGASNAVNLTDGLDGLAAGNMIFCAISFAIFAYLAGNINFAHYLKIVSVPGAGEITVFMGALAGACLGFLWFNAYPAQVFMGDTSSLFLGGIIGVAALCVKQEIILPIVGGAFVAETLSVIIQIVYFKATGGKRIFRMAPLHHHYELGGLAESKVTVRFWIMSVILMIIALGSLKVR